MRKKIQSTGMGVNNAARLEALSNRGSASPRAPFNRSRTAPGTPAPFVAMGHLHFDSLEALQAAFEQHAAEIMADIPNYTEIAPVMQISEVKM